MRARMALFYSGIQVDIEEVDFKNKPARLLEMSPKGTVPFLCLHDGSVIDESLDIINWALNENDPEGWLDTDAAETQRLIQQNDGAFKKALDPERALPSATELLRLDAEKEQQEAGVADLDKKDDFDYGLWIPGARSFARPR